MNEIFKVIVEEEEEEDETTEKQAKNYVYGLISETWLNLEKNNK